MIYTELIKKALVLCYKAHSGQLDKGGIPYVFHPYHLAEQMQDETGVIVALLHDVVEDTAYTFDDIAALGFPEDVLDALSLLTHAKEMPYERYIERIAGNRVAMAVKIADLEHNSDASRLDGNRSLSSQSLMRQQKYEKALKFLREKEALEKV